MGAPLCTHPGFVQEKGDRYGCTLRIICWRGEHAKGHGSTRSSQRPTNGWKEHGTTERCILREWSGGVSDCSWGSPKSSIKGSKMHWGVTNIEAVRCSRGEPRVPRQGVRQVFHRRVAPHTPSSATTMPHSTRCASSSPVNSLGHYKPAGAFDDIRGGGLVLPVVRTRLRFERDACMSRKRQRKPSNRSIRRHDDHGLRRRVVCVCAGQSTCWQVRS